jgi:uncharacterized protein YcnI
MEGVHLKRSIIGAMALCLTLLSAVPASAHVTVQPNEAIAGSFSRFVVRVPNERDDASTIKVEMELPPLAFVSFQDAPGWDRKIAEGEFSEPIQAFGQELTEGVLSVTWSGGEVGPGEFTEFGFSAAMPEGETTLEFKAIQTYDSGEVVEWADTGEDAEHPAPSLSTYDLGGAEGGQIAALDQLADDSDGSDASDASEASDESDDEDEDDDEELDLGVILGGVGIVLAGAALIMSRKKGSAE